MGVSHLARRAEQERWQQGKPRRPLYRCAGETWSTVAADPRAHVAARAAALDGSDGGFLHFGIKTSDSLSAAIRAAGSRGDVFSIGAAGKYRQLATSSSSSKQ